MAPMGVSPPIGLTNHRGVQHSSPLGLNSSRATMCGMLAIHNLSLHGGSRNAPRARGWSSRRGSAERKSDKRCCTYAAPCSRYRPNSHASLGLRGTRATYTIHESINLSTCMRRAPHPDGGAARVQGEVRQWATVEAAAARGAADRGEGGGAERGDGRRVTGGEMSLHSARAAQGAPFHASRRESASRHTSHTRLARAC